MKGPSPSRGRASLGFGGETWKWEDRITHPFSPSIRTNYGSHREPAKGSRAILLKPMLDLEVLPERSLGNEQWEFTLGKYRIPALWGFPPRIREKSGKKHSFSPRIWGKKGWKKHLLDPTLSCFFTGLDFNPIIHYQHSTNWGWRESQSQPTHLFEGAAASPVLFRSLRLSNWLGAFKPIFLNLSNFKLGGLPFPEFIARLAGGSWELKPIQLKMAKLEKNCFKRPHF